MYIHKVHRNRLIAKFTDSVNQLECHLLLAFILINCKYRLPVMVDILLLYTNSIIWMTMIIQFSFCLICHTYKHAVLSIIEIHVVASYYRQEKHLEEVEQCTRTHAAVISSMKTRGDLENMFIHDVSRTLPINRSSAAEVKTSIFTSFKGVPVWYAYDTHVIGPESALHFICYK